MDGEIDIIETDGDIKEDGNQAEQNDGKSSYERPEGFPFLLCDI